MCRRLDHCENKSLNYKQGKQTKSTTDFASLNTCVKTMVSTHCYTVFICTDINDACAMCVYTRVCEVLSRRHSKILCLGDFKVCSDNLSSICVM